MVFWKLGFVLTLALSVCSLALAADEEPPAPESATEPVPADPIYVSMNPHFTSNLSGAPGGRPSFIQMKAYTLVSSNAAKEALNLHMPAIRHEVLHMLSQLAPSDLASVEQKDQLREEVVRVIRSVLEPETNQDEIADFYITSLIVQ